MNYAELSNAEELVIGLMASIGGVLLIILGISLLLAIVSLIAQYKYVSAVGNDPGISVIVPFWNSYTFANTVPADAEGKVTLVGGLKVSKTIFSFYWLVTIAVGIIPVIGGIASLVIGVVCAFVIYREAYVRIDGKQQNEVTAISIVTIFIPLVFVVKVLSGNNRMNKNNW